MNDSGFLAPPEWNERFADVLWEMLLPRCSFCRKRDADADEVIVFRSWGYGPAHRACAEDPEAELLP